MFTTKDEQVFFNDYLNHGYIIRPAADMEALEWVTKQFINLISKK